MQAPPINGCTLPQENASGKSLGEGFGACVNPEFMREGTAVADYLQPSITVIGTSDVYKTGTGYAVTPVLAVVPPDLELQPSPTEVAAWFEAPVDFVFDRANHVEQTAYWQAQERRYIEIMWQEHRIWGVTAAIIANLARRIAW